MSDRAVDTVIVGAGPHGLTVAAYLVHLGGADPDRLTVIDPAGRWLAAWRSAFAALGIEHLRSPVVHQPHPDPYALLDHAREHGRTTELHGRYQTPGTTLFDAFCDHVIEGAGLGDRVVAGTAHGVDPDGTVRWRDETGAPRTLRARRIVLAHHPGRPVMPTPMPDRVGRATPVHATDVDLCAVAPGQHVVVIGGGLTAGHLVCGAAERGARVTLLTRRPVVEREFDTDPGWLGPREMRRFLAETCLETRIAMAVAARGGGSMPGWMVRRLDDLGPRLHRTCLAPGVSLATELARGGDADHVWCATGWRTATTSDPLLTPLPTRRVGEHLVLGTRLEAPGTCVHVVGAPAALHLGPTAGNLAGARLAAESVVGAIHAID